MIVYAFIKNIIRRR